MEIRTQRVLQDIAGSDGHVTTSNLQELDSDQNGTISETEAEEAGIAPCDRETLNRAYSEHSSDPNAVIFNRREMRARGLQQFVQEKFRQLDGDNDGFISKDELDNALSSNFFTEDEKSLIRDLRQNIGDLEEYSNDEWFDENDGITLDDINTFAQEEIQASQRTQLQRTANGIEAVELQQFVKNNFHRLDQDDDGFISQRELDHAVADPSFQGRDAAALAVLERYVEDIEEFSNDEWFDENDGITLNDMETFVREIESNPTGKPQADMLNYYFSASRRLGEANHNLYADGNNPLESIRLNHMEQGSIGDCFFLSAVAAVVDRNPQEIADMIQDNGNGTFTVSFPGADRPVTVNAPTDTELALYATSGQDGMWLTILEKAYGELRNRAYGAENSHDAIDGGDFQAPAIKVLTGHTADTDYMPFTSNNTIREKLNAALNPPNGQPRLVTASSFMDGDNDRNIIPNHVFTILSYDPTTDTVRVRNPWGEGSDATGIQFPDPDNDGVFTLTIDELDEYFNLIAYEEPTPIRNYDHLGSRYNLSGGLDLGVDFSNTDIPF